MTAQEFSDIQEALIYVLGNLASWWLVLAFVGSMSLGILMFVLGFARFLFSKRMGMPQSSQPL